MFQEDAENWHFGYYSIPKNDGTIKSNKSAMTIFLSGATSGLISRTMTAPADRVKVMLQASTSSNASIKSVVGDVLKEGGGIKGFWKGNGTNVIKIMPESAVKFYANDFFKSLIIKDQDNVQPHERLLAGSMAGVTAQSFIYPLEVVKTRLAIAAKGEYSSIAHCISKIIKKEGPKALYKGLGASNIGIIPYAGVDLAMYGTLKASWLKRNKDKKPQWYDLLLMGSLSSFTGQTCAYPLQLIRTRLQSSGMSRPVYNGMSDVVRDGSVPRASFMEALRKFCQRYTSNCQQGRVRTVFKVVPKHCHSITNQNKINQAQNRPTWHTRCRSRQWWSQQK